MFTIFLVLITIVCLLLIVVIMVQNPKSGGLSSSLGGSSSMLGGVQKTTDFLDRSTWVLGGLLMVLILFSSITLNSTYGDSGSKLIDNSVTAPAMPQPAPAATQAPATEAPAATTEAPVQQ